MTGADEPGHDEPGRLPSVRIGDAERNAASDALHQHLAAGRLTLDEFADRSTQVLDARTQDELDRVFHDLPLIAGPPGRSGSGALHRAAGALAGVPPKGRSAMTRPLVAGLMAGIPMIALLLFFITGLWYFFLLIPLAYTVLGPMVNAAKREAIESRREPDQDDT